MSAPQPDLREALAWRDMASAPHSTPIVAKHSPNKAMPNGWVGTITRADPEQEEGRFGYPDTILHYNGEALLGRFYGCWEGWLYPHEVGSSADLIARVEKAERERDEAQVAAALAGPVYSRRKILAECDAATARAEAAEAEIGRLRKRIALMERDEASECPFAGPPKSWAHIGVNDPCPVCGDLGTLANGDGPSNCPDVRRPEPARTALKPQEAEDGH